MLRLLFLSIALLSAAACASLPPPASPAAAGATTALTVVQRIDHLDNHAREPMVVEHPKGALFVAGYGAPRPTLWRSDDRGVSWSRVDVGSEEEGAVGNSDVDLAVAPDGTLYFASMLFDRTNSTGLQISIGVSTDAGRRWRWTTLSRDLRDDRPWVEVTRDGTAHVIWNDGIGVSHAVSRDRGITWREMPRIHDKGGSSHLAVGPRNELAVRITPLSASGNQFDEGVDLIAVSTDGGTSWTRTAAPGERDWVADLGSPTATPRWVEPLAWDAAGDLYYLWTHVTGTVHLARSQDRGRSWTTWRVAENGTRTFFPYLVARGRGELAATWFTASDADMNNLRWQLARISVGHVGAQPTLIASEVQTLESIRRRHGKGETLYNDPAGEYLPVSFLRDGSIAVVTPIQNTPERRTGFTWWRFR